MADTPESPSPKPAEASQTPVVPGPVSRSGEGLGLVSLIAIGTVLLLTAFATYQALATNNFPDFFIYRAGAEIGLRGESPYHIETIREEVAAQFTDETFIANCGYFLPPGAITVFAPFAAVPYPIAKVLWAIVVGLSAAGAVQLTRTFAAPLPPSPVALLLPALLLLNPLVTATVVVGQTSLLFVGCVAAGQWFFERGRPTVGALLWAIPFVKPHLALPLLPLAWYLGGWKRAAAVAGVVAGLTLVGCLIAGGSPLFFREYLDFLGSGHKAVVFNQVALNPQITSWNRLLIALGGPVIELTATTTLAGYLVWLGLVLGRVAIGSVKPTAAWAVAVAAIGALECSQVLGYELVLLMLVVPWARELFAAKWQLRGWAVVCLMVAQFLPLEVFEPLGFESHRPVGVALLALVVLTGPLVPSHQGGARIAICSG